MPSLYAAIGRRLGYPIRLVSCKEHGFARWDDPAGERFNIECTARGFVSHADDYYRHWPLETTAAEVSEYQLLQSHTPAEEISGFQSRRGHVRLAHRQYGNAAFEFVRAYHTTPLKAIENCIHRATIAWGKELRAQVGQGFPGLSICNQPSRHPGLPWNLQCELNYLHALELMLNDPVKKASWWDPLRRNRKCRPLGMPEWIKATYPPGGHSLLKFEPCSPPSAPPPELVFGLGAGLPRFHQ
jgi:hypothetical protein